MKSMKNIRFDPKVDNDNNPRKISYDDILASLNMTLENGRLVITRNIVQENQRIGISEEETFKQESLKQQSIKQQSINSTINSKPVIPVIQETPLQKLKRTLEEKNKLTESKSTKMFFNNNIKMSNSNSKTNLKQMQMQNF